MKLKRPASSAVAVVLAATVSLGLLAGCATSEADAPATTDTATTGTAAPETTSAEAATTGLTVGADGTQASYQGVTGKTALDLLLELDPSAEVQGEGANAFVTAIAGRAADDAKKEFWALYVDDEQAQVGAGSLDTTDGQTITWKLETY